MSTSIVAIILVLSATVAIAEPLPVQKPPAPGGSCPSGYLSSGSYCVPSSSRQDAIPKSRNGSCPWGGFHLVTFACAVDQQIDDETRPPPLHTMRAPGCSAPAELGRYLLSRQEP
jgi:hypothetical protein